MIHGHSQTRAVLYRSVQNNVASKYRERLVWPNAGESPLAQLQHPAAAAAVRRTQERKEGRKGGPGLGTEPEEAPRPPLDGVGLHSHSNGYGSDTEEGVYSERRSGAEEPHHGLQVDITTPAGCLAAARACVFPNAFWTSWMQLFGKRAQKRKARKM